MFPKIIPDLSKAIIQGKTFEDAYLEYANLQGASILGTFFHRAHLKNANFTGAKIQSANFTSADLSYAILKEAHIVGVDFREANLMNTDLQHAQIGYTIFGRNDLSTSKGLESVKHFGPSTIGIDTIYESKGKIPESFLRGAGIPDNFIVFMHSLTEQAIEFYSCFISYSAKDQSFAERLYADLQNRGVRCWFAPEDLKIGDKFRQRIDDSIRIHDKLLVVLSQVSILSAWVEDEVESAMERERTEKRPVLFPIRIDDFVMNSDKAWAAALRRTRHIGDFAGWKDHDTYKKAFDRLIRDLKSNVTSRDGA